MKKICYTMFLIVAVVMACLTVSFASANDPPGKRQAPVIMAGTTVDDNLFNLCYGPAPGIAGSSRITTKFEKGGPLIFGSNLTGLEPDIVIKV